MLVYRFSVPYTADDYLFEHKIKACVKGHNLIKYSGKTVPECKQLCNQRADCLAFEFGVDHGGSSTTYKPGDCQLQSSADASDCDGKVTNLDLYVKGKKTRTGSQKRKANTIHDL